MAGCACRGVAAQWLFAGQILQLPRSGPWDIRALANRAGRRKNGQDACRARGFGAQASAHQEGREADYRPLQPRSTGVLGDACRSLELERNELKNYELALRISQFSLRRWRDLIADEELVID